MWIPKSAAEIEEAAQRGDLEETQTFDAKAALPAAKKNHDLAVDVSAMTVAGGSLVYGLGEDTNKRLTVRSPIKLEGAPERVAQIVETSVSESPFIRVQALPSDSDPARGYLLVVVPQSARAPHQVITGGDMRYYGRGAKGNRILSEGEIAKLYAQREQWEVDREHLLEMELARAPELDPSLGYVVAFARPVVPDDAMVERVGASGQEISAVLLAGARSWGNVRADREGHSYDPDLRNAINTWRRGAAGWTLSTVREQEDDDPKNIQHTAKVELDFDGTGHFFCGRIVDTMRPGVRILFETILAGNLASFFAAMGELYEAAGYMGNVDVGIALIGIEGAAPWGLHHWGDNKFSGPVPRRTLRVSAAELRDDAKGVSLSLIRRLLDVTRGTSWSPFEEPPPAEPSTK
jgi:hypothetical protein